MKVIITYPGRNRERLRDLTSSLVETFSTSTKEFSFKPLINGAALNEMKELSSELKSLNPEIVNPFISLEGNIVKVLFHGYENIVDSEKDDCLIVRMDTSEHPIKEIPNLLTYTGNPNFDYFGIYSRQLDEKNASKEEIEANEIIWPQMYLSLTQNKLSLPSTHGFQAFSVRTLKKVLPTARKIIKGVPDGENLIWGMDAAMALAAVVENIEVKLGWYWLDEMRNRSKHKIEEQLKNHFHLLLSARKILFAD